MLETSTVSAGGRKVRAAFLNDTTIDDLDTDRGRVMEWVLNESHGYGYGNSSSKHLEMWNVFHKQRQTITKPNLQ